MAVARLCAFAWFDTLIRHPRILDAIEDVIGPDILVWTSTFFIKEPHSPTFAAWHQDGTYFGLEPHEQVCAWVALTDASRKPGAWNNYPAGARHGSCGTLRWAWRTASIVPARRSWSR